MGMNEESEFSFPLVLTSPTVIYNSTAANISNTRIHGDTTDIEYIDIHVWLYSNHTQVC